MDWNMMYVTGEWSGQSKRNIRVVVLFYPPQMIVAKREMGEKGLFHIEG
jgi:hypothetical protein